MTTPAHSSEPLTDEEKRALREKAQNATPGPWKKDRNWTITGPNNDWERHWMAPLVGQDLSKFDPFYTEIVAHIHGPGRERGNRADADFAFIAACDPQTILRLVDELERQVKWRAENEASLLKATGLYFGEIDRLRADLATARERIAQLEANGNFAIGMLGDDAVRLATERETLRARLDSARAILEEARDEIEGDAYCAEQHELVKQIDSWLAGGGKTTAAEIGGSNR